ncbi:MAG: DNA-binding protein [Rhizobium sp.]|nr:DNA-binding protein [Rhizobium sp.]
MENIGQPSIELIWGACEIGRLIGRTQRQTFHLLESGELPARKVGGRWVVERGKLLRFFAEDAA